MSDHRAKYKNTGLDARELRRRREEQGVQLRKQKRDDVFSKRRTHADDMIDDEDTFTATKPSPIITQEMIDGILQNDNLQTIIDNAQKVRKILSIEPQPPIDDVISAGLIPRFAQLLGRHDCSILQFEVAWILTNVASGTSEQTRVVFESGAVPTFIQLMQSAEIRVCEQAVWALGNLIGDGEALRDEIIKQGIVEVLLPLVRKDIDISFLRNITWVIVNLCRNKNPPPPSSVVKQLLPAISYLLDIHDLSILMDATWALSYVTESGSEQVQAVIDSGIVKKLLPLLNHRDHKLQIAAIRAVGSLVTGTDEQTQVVIDLGALPRLKSILLSGKDLNQQSRDKISKETLWFLSNIAAGDFDQIQAVIDEDIIPLVIEHLDKGEYNSQREAAWIVYNMTVSASPKQIAYLVSLNVIEPVCNLLSLKETDTLQIALDTLYNILKSYENNFTLVAEQIESCGGLDKIEHLQNHLNEDIYNLAYRMIDQYFNTEATQEDENVRPKASENSYEFSSSGANNHEFTFN